MKRWLLILVVCLFACNLFAMEKWQGFCEYGGQRVSMASLGQSTGKFIGSYPACTVTVYDHGTANLSTIYSDNGVTPQPNPFTADSITGIGSFYASNGEYDIQFSGASLPATWTLSDVLLLDINNPKFIGSIYFASGYAGADWCGQAMAADSSFAGQPLFLIIDNNVASKSACATAPQPAANHTWFFDASTTFSLGSQSLAPAGSNTRVYGQGYGTILTCTTGYCYDNDTHTGAYLGDLEIQPATTASGAVRIQHRTSASNANNVLWHVRANAQSYTASQVGFLFYTAGNGDSNYGNQAWVQTLNMDIGAKFQSANAVTNGSNANLLWIICNGHTFCVDVPNGTDEEIHVSALGSHNLTGGTAVRLGGTSGGNAYGASNDVVYIGREEQGSASVTVDYESGAQVNAAYGVASDVTNIVDNSGVATNRSNIGGVLYHPIVSDNCMPLGGVASASSVAYCRSGTTAYAALGDNSAKTVFGATKYQIIVNSALVDALSTTQMNLGATSNLRQAQLLGINTASNLWTLALMSNNTSSDFSTFVSDQSSYGSMTLALQTNTTDANSAENLYYRNGGAADGVGTKIRNTTNAGLGQFLGGVAPMTAGGATSGTALLPWSSIYLGSAATNNIRLTGTAASAQVATLPDNTGTLAELNLAQTWSAAQSFSSSIKVTNLLLSATAPTISSGFGSSPSIATNNGTAAFSVNVGTGGTATNGVIGLPTATNGWNCTCTDITTQSSTVFYCKQKATSATTATIANYNTSAVESAWVASDIVQVSCLAR